MRLYLAAEALEAYAAKLEPAVELLTTAPEPQSRIFDLARGCLQGLLERLRLRNARWLFGDRLRLGRGNGPRRVESGDDLWIEIERPIFGARQRGDREGIG